nr:ABC transporter permease [uncultured Mucilaginibacter sp.]
MLKNYVKIAFRVMMRQKFFTAVSIFGISFTIMIFSITAGVADLMFGDIAPAVNRSRTLYFDGFNFPKNNGYATTAFYNDARKIADIERLSIFIHGQTGSFEKDKKIVLSAAFTDEEVWNLYQFEFTEGKPFTRKDVAEAQSIAIITESVKKFYFGDGKALGKYLPTSPRLKVTGVIKDFVLIAIRPRYSTEKCNIFIPVTRRIAAGDIKQDYQATILMQKDADVAAVKKGLLDLIDKKYNPGREEIYMDARDIYEVADLQEVGIFMGGFIFFIMLVPALNLVGLNVNRISERSSEIGIRKAFGASSAVLAGQFITENLIITFIGGVLGILMTLISSGLAIKIIYYNESIRPSSDFLVNWTVIGCALIASFFFGILSGVVPAWRMSRLHAVKALKGGNL